MEQQSYNLWSFVFQAISGTAIAVFAFFQWKINARLKKLEDYVAVSIVPMGAGDLRLQILNVGKINLYLQKYEIGTDHESFAKPMLIPAGSNSFLLVAIKNYNLGQNLDITLYLIDELGEKFISTGEAKVENISLVKQTPASQGSTSPTFETINVPQAVAWAYKTIKKDWEL